MKNIKDLLTKEPLVLFILLGSLIFVGFNYTTSQPTQLEQKLEIKISRQQIDSLVLGFTKVWQRKPSELEQTGLIKNYIKEEILYREALALGLDKDDSIVRRRLSQKMQFITEDIVDVVASTDQELNEFLQKNQETYRKAAIFSFIQVYINPNKHLDTLEVVTKSLLNKLSQSEYNITEISDPLMLSNEFINVSTDEISRQLGNDFLDSFLKIEKAKWQGPIRSGFGYHLVFINEYIPDEIPSLAEVREIVERDWLVLKRKQFNDNFYNTLRAQYNVIIENSESSKSINSNNISKTQ